MQLEKSQKNGETQTSGLQAQGSLLSQQILIVFLSHAQFFFYLYLLKHSSTFEVWMIFIEKHTNKVNTWSRELSWHIDFLRILFYILNVFNGLQTVFQNWGKNPQAELKKSSEKKKKKHPKTNQTNKKKQKRILMELPGFEIMEVMLSLLLKESNEEKSIILF